MSLPVTGQRVSFVVALSPSWVEGHRRLLRIRCDCGVERDMLYQQFSHCRAEGLTLTCGHLKPHKPWRPSELPAILLTGRSPRRNGKWDEVGRQLNRTPMSCRKKWDELKVNPP